MFGEPMDDGEAFLELPGEEDCETGACGIF